MFHVKKIFLFSAVLFALCVLNAQAESQNLSKAVNDSVISHQEGKSLDNKIAGFSNVVSVSIQKTSDVMSLVDLSRNDDKSKIFLIGIDGKYLANALKSSTEYDILLLALKRASKNAPAHMYLMGNQNAFYVGNLIVLAAQTNAVLEIGKTPVEAVVTAVHDKLRADQFINISTTEPTIQSALCPLRQVHCVNLFQSPSASDGEKRKP